MLFICRVEAALTTDQNNAELQKLRGDLNEVITLTKNLIEAQNGAGGSNIDTNPEAPERDWKVGDECQAVWSEDGHTYDATIDAITEEGLVSVTFEGYNNSDVTTLSALKMRKPGEKKTGASSSGTFTTEEKSRKRHQEEQRAHAKKRKQKKFDRLKQIEEAHEADKAKWQAFTSKQNKKMKGIVRKSIFATPDAVNGRVGIGTCGIGGKPMTEYTQAEKWRKGT
ncbi:survival of motor neuron-related-splicing factor 30 isoform X2 [Oratosquilla oratoria]|uniref:survival of motor neuron-related-splicing factor 30 isoform X2 n=1 Tax=Oratosquilla oratoria TaxID=337810 RepID=UPI003F769138